MNAKEMEGIANIIEVENGWRVNAKKHIDSDNAKAVGMHLTNAVFELREAAKKAREVALIQIGLGPDPTEEESDE